MVDDGVALDGPRSSPTQQNFFEFNGQGYIDDVLNEHQEDVVCGVYRVMDGELFFIHCMYTNSIKNDPTETNSTSRSPFMSWWPSATTWKTSGMGVGYRSPDLEKWFVERRARILAGNERPRNSTEWKSALRRRGTETQNLLRAARKLAANSLPGVPSG